MCDRSSEASCDAVVFKPVLLVGVLNFILQLDLLHCTVYIGANFEKITAERERNVRA